MQFFQRIFKHITHYKTNSVKRSQNSSLMGTIVEPNIHKYYSCIDLVKFDHTEMGSTMNLKLATFSCFHSCFF